MASDYQIDKCLASLDTVYPQHFGKMTAENAKLARGIYHRILQDIHGALLEAAVMQWLSTARPFHPSPGELRDMALSLVEASEPSADEAWAEIMQEWIKHYDVCRSWQLLAEGYFDHEPEWSNESISIALESFGGWSEFFKINPNQQQYIRSQFLNIYKAQVTRRHEDRLMLPETREMVAQHQIAQLTDAKRLPQRTGGEG